MSEIRIDPITRRQVIFAKDRDLRPTDLWTKAFLTQIPMVEFYDENCPFCKGNEEETPPEVIRYPENEDWKVRIIPNKFPAIEEGDSQVKRIKTHALFEKYVAIGQHDVVVESPFHNDNYFSMSKEDLYHVFSLIHQRYSQMIQEEPIDFVSFFKNYQRLAGASLYHPHSQLIGLNSVPDFVRYEVEGAALYYEKSGTCPYCDILNLELSKKERLVYDNEFFAAICPYAPKYKYELWILPKKHQPFFDKEEYILALSQIIHKSFSLLYGVLSDFPYNMYLHALPKSMGAHRNYYHYHFEINPRLSGNAGFELGTGIFINSIFPEVAAAKLRKNI